jgi:hypothetical protein
MWNSDSQGNQGNNYLPSYIASRNYLRKYERESDCDADR